MAVLLSVYLPDTLWVSGAFVKRGEDTVLGYFYVKPGEKVVYKVIKPVNQIMLILPETLVIYYPDHKKAFKIRHHYVFTDGLFSFNAENLLRLGFVLEGEDTTGDTVIKTYKHPDMGVKAVIKSVGGSVREYIGYGVRGEEVLRVRYGEFKEVYRGFRFPDRVEITAANSTESYDYYGVSVVGEGGVPDYVVNFKIPEDVEVVYKGWE